MIRLILPGPREERQRGHPFSGMRISTTPLTDTNGFGVMFVLESMNKTFTPDLDPEVLGRLEAYAGRFRDLFNVPRSFNDVFNGTAFRGGGQEFRLDIQPGTNINRFQHGWLLLKMTVYGFFRLKAV